MREVYVMVGLPASGKSTWVFQNMYSEDSCVISSDEIKEEVFGSKNKYSQSDDLTVLSIIRDKYKMAIRKGIDKIYIDATNIRTAERKFFFENSKVYKVIAVFLDPPLETCLTRNPSRSKKVPPRLIKRMAKYLQRPEVGVDCHKVKYIVNAR